MIELLIALSLVSLMLVLLFGGLRLGGRSWDAVEAHSTESSDQRLVWAFLQRTLTEMQAVKLRRDAKLRVVFNGDAEAVEFVGLMPARLGPGGAYLLRLEAPRSGETRALVMRRWLYHPEVLEGMEDVPAWTPLYERVGEAKPLREDEQKGSALYGEHLLVGGIEKLEIEYYGKTKGAGSAEWHDRWKEQATMPELIRLSLYTEKGAWPPLVAALPTTSTAGRRVRVPQSRSRRGQRR